MGLCTAQASNSMILFAHRSVAGNRSVEVAALRLFSRLPNVTVQRCQKFQFESKDRSARPVAAIYIT